MDTTQPTQDDKNLVDQNQQIGQSANPPATPSPPINQPTQSNIPLQEADHNLGVGTPNIGVEKKQIDVSAPTSDQPPQTHTPSDDIKPTFTSSARDKNETTPEDTTQSTNKEFQIDVAEYSQQPPPSISPSNSPAGGSPKNLTPINVKNYQSPQNNNASQPQPPIKAGGSNISLVIFIILALILGSAGGFFGYRYFDQLKTSASVETTAKPAESPSLDVNTWTAYTSTLYNFSLKFPTGWATSTTDENSSTLVFAENEESLAGTPTGFKIEVDFQNSNGQTLKKWVETNTVTTGEKKAAKEITVSGQTVYQQELSKNGPQVATYIERSDKIMIITYSAPPSHFGSGGEWYNTLINSIKLI